MILTSFVYAVHASALFQVTNISVTVTKFVPVCLVFLSVLKVQVFQKNMFNKEESHPGTVLFQLYFCAISKFFCSL